MADTTQQTGLNLSGVNKNTNKYLNYYNQISTQLMENPNKISYQAIEVPEQTYQGLADQISAYLRPYADTAIRQRRTQTASDRAAADVDAASRGMVSSTWLSDAKNRMAAAEAADIAGIENSYQSNLMNQVYNSYQDYLNRQYNAAVQNAQNQLAVDEFNAQLYQTLDNLAWNRAQQMYKMNKSGGGGSGAGSGMVIIDGTQANPIGGTISGITANAAAGATPRLNQAAMNLLTTKQQAAAKNNNTKDNQKQTMSGQQR